ncbi:hypothetical protein DBR06_SOUSAS6210032, partial [Sousa chinensis]
MTYLKIQGIDNNVSRLQSTHPLQARAGSSRPRPLARAPRPLLSSGHTPSRAAQPIEQGPRPAPQGPGSGFHALRADIFHDLISGWVSGKRRPVTPPPTGPAPGDALSPPPAPWDPPGRSVRIGPTGSPRPGKEGSAPQSPRSRARGALGGHAPPKPPGSGPGAPPAPRAPGRGGRTGIRDGAQRLSSSFEFISPWVCFPHLCRKQSM